MMLPLSGVRTAGKPAHEIAAAVAACRTILIAAGIFSGLINLLALSSSIYMLQVYDRVIPSHSVQTLVGLSVAMLVLFIGYGAVSAITANGTATFKTSTTQPNK